MQIIKSAILLIILLSSGFSQIKIFRTLTVEDGLMQSSVSSIYQDSDGYMWFGTLHGLSRWDGISFKNYHTVDGLIGARINFITEDKNNNLLIGTDNGLSILKNNKFLNYTFDEKKILREVLSICVTSDNRIFLGKNNGLFEFINGKIKNISNDPAFSGYPVNSVIENKNKEILFCIVEKGLAGYDGKKVRLIDESDHFKKRRSGNAINGFSEGEIYFSLPDGYLTYKNGKIDFYNLINDDDVYIRRIIPGNKNEIIAASNKGIMIFRGKNCEVINKANGLPAEFVLSIRKDNNNVYYFGLNSGGVALYDGGKIFSLNDKTGLSSNYIYGVTEGADGRMYFSSSNGGINIYNNGEIKQLTQKNSLLPTSFCSDVIADKKGLVYAASSEGLIKLENDRFVKLYTQKDGLLRNYVRAVNLDQKGVLFIATGSGINTLDNGKIGVYKNNDKIISRMINTFIVRKNENIVIGYEDRGISIIGDNFYKNLSEKDKLANNKVLSLFEASDGRLFVGTQGGLSVINQDKIENYTTKNGLSDNTIYGIGEDNYKNIYLITNKGVNILTPKTNGFSIRYLTSRNGLTGDELNVEGIHKDLKGRMWFGTLKGISCFDPAKDISAIVPPNISVSSIKLFENSITEHYTGEKLEFEYNQNYLRFQFWGVNLSEPEKVKYQYRLTSIDPEWVDTDYRFARYANLVNGDYIFEVRAKYQGGEWSAPVNVKFAIAAPLYKTWWFLTLVSIFVLGSIAAIIILRVRQVIMIEKLRSKLSADLHDHVGAGLTEISILSEVVAFAKERNTDDITKTLNLISKTARKLVDNMSDIVWLVNPKRDSLYDLILRLEEANRELFLSKGISYQSKNITDLASISLPMEYRQHLFLLFKEAINNSVKHSNCTNIVLDANIEGKKLAIKIADNGKGFDFKNVKKGQGLQNMINRADNIKGRLKIESGAEIGTVILFEGRIN